jgi:hypothetical protein
MDLLQILSHLFYSEHCFDFERSFFKCTCDRQVLIAVR